MPTYVTRARKSLSQPKPVNTAKRIMQAMPVDPYGFMVYARGKDKHNVYASPSMRHRAEQLFAKAYPAQKEYADAYGIGLDMNYYVTTQDGDTFTPTPEFPDRKKSVGLWQSRNSVENSGRKFKIWARAFDTGRKDGAALKIMHLAFRQTGKFPHVKVSSILNHAKTLTADDKSEDCDLTASIEAIFHADGSPYFSAGAFDYARDEVMPLKSRATLILMSPDAFLKMAKNLSKPSAAKTAHVATANGNFRDIPRLSFHNNGDGTARVVGHEGRHRMYFLKDKGVSRVPVLFVSQPGAGDVIRWGAATGFDAVDPWPKTLQGEGNTNTMPFPVSEIYPRSTHAVTAFDISHIKPGQSFEYLHNKQSSRIFTVNQDFGQAVEPAGRYMIYVDPESPVKTPDGWEKGSLVFKNPLSLPWGSAGHENDYSHPDNWKQHLSQAFNGKTGEKLSQAVRDKGFDGIVTYDKYGPSEIVDLTLFKPKERTLTGEADYSEYGFWITDTGDLITVPQERHANVARNWIEKNDPRSVDDRRDEEGHLNAIKAFDFVQTERGWIRIQNHGLECNIALVQNTVTRPALKALSIYLKESPFRIFVVDISGDGYVHKEFMEPKDAFSFAYQHGKRNITALIEAAELKIKATDRQKYYGKSLYDQGKHDYLVIYRAIPKTVTEFKPGDYVTLSRKFAVEHAEHVHAMGDSAHVIKIVADPRKVYDAMNPGEYFYGGEVKRGKVFYTAGQDLEANSGDNTMRADLLASLQERMVALHAEEGQSYTNKTQSVKALFYKNRSTAQLCKPGQTVKAKAGYGKRTKVRSLTPDELAQAKKGVWLRIRENGAKPTDKGSKKSAYRPWLHASIERCLEAAYKKSNNSPDIEKNTDIIPSMVADTILQEVWQELPDFYSKRKDIITYLHEKSNTVYANNETFMKKVKGKNGLNTLYAFMRHWAASYIKKNWGDAAYKALNKSNPGFSNGKGRV